MGGEGREGRGVNSVGDKGGQNEITQRGEKVKVGKT